MNNPFTPGERVRYGGAYTSAVQKAEANAVTFRRPYAVFSDAKGNWRVQRCDKQPPPWGTKLVLVPCPRCRCVYGTREDAEGCCAPSPIYGEVHCGRSGCIGIVQEDPNALHVEEDEEVEED